MRKIVKICLLAFVPFFVFSQEVVLDNNAPSVQWRQINTPGFRLIYPAGFDDQAQRMANLLEKIRSAEAETMGEELPKKISIVIQSQNAISNGFVTLAPRRSEFYTMPPQDYKFLGTNKWLNMLPVHEYRHVVQFYHGKTGWNKLLYYLFGENTQAALAFSAAPQWFWEGDATAIETGYTHSGRGRMPSFNRVFRANLLEGKRFNYNKQYLRSYKDFVPDHYVLGYHYATFLKRKTDDPYILGKISHDAFSWPFIPFTFSNAMKKHTGQYIVRNYEQMMDELDSLWRRQLDGVELTSFTRVNKRVSDDFTDLSFPQVLENGTVIALKSGIGDIEHFVAINEDGSSEKVFVPGVISNTGMLSLQQQRLVWNEYFFHPRWRAKTYSVIKAYDFNTGKARTITRRSRYGGAAISPDGQQIVTVLTTESQQHYLTLISYDTGEEIKRFENPGNAFYAMPGWSDDGRRIVALKITDQGKSVIAFDVVSGEEKILVGAGHENIGYPVLHKKYLLFNSAATGIDNIFALDLLSGQRYQVTSSKYGAYNPAISPDGQNIYYNDHTVNGLDVVKIPWDPEHWKPVEAGREADPFYEDLADQDHENFLDNIPSVEYPVRKYSELGHILNIHSWGPLASTELNQVDFGIFSQDVLSTTSLSAGYSYDLEEENGFASANLSYQGFLPIIDLEVEKGSRTSNRGTVDAGEVKLSWDELSVEGGVRIPLLLTRSKYHTQLTVGNSVRYTRVSDFRNSVFAEDRFVPVNDSLALFLRDELADGDLLTNQANLSFFKLLKRSPRDINSQWGQTFSVEHFSTPYGGDFEGRLFAARASLYFPSPGALLFPRAFKHHSFYVRYGYQSRDADLKGNLYYFRNRIIKPRGYDYPTHEKFSSLSFNYTFPIWYPDIALGPILNIKRFRANAFYDIGKGTGTNYYVTYNTLPANVYSVNIDETYRSVGGELLMDFNIMRFKPEISMGARYSYLLSTNEINVEFIVANIAF